MRIPRKRESITVAVVGIWFLLFVVGMVWSEMERPAMECRK